MRRLSTKLAALVAVVALWATAGQARAGLTLTAAGVADGFTLSTYASGGSNNNYPFLAAATLSNGTLAVIDFQNGFLRQYADVNGQTPGSALNSVAFGGAINIANANGKTYAVSQSQGLFEVSNTLGLTHINTPGFGFSLGLAGNPVSGHLFAAGSGSNGSGIYDINPLTGTSTFIAGGGFDGVSVSPDGTTVYVELNGNSVVGYDITTHNQVFSFGSSHAPDGTAVITGGTFNGYVVVNNNDGTVSLVTPNGSSSQIIATGGSRGDFVSPDSNNGSLLLSQYGEMDRLFIAGGSFSATPEPSSLVLLGMAALSGAAYRGWRRRKPAAA